MQHVPVKSTSSSLTWKRLDTLRENCGIIHKQASTDDGMLWEVVRVNVVQVRRKDRSLRDPKEARSCVRGGPEFMVSTSRVDAELRTSANQLNSSSLYMSRLMYGGSFDYLGHCVSIKGTGGSPLTPVA
ncbi:hypothetical protein TNCV_1028011 [Trichonephila clavipes]|nr:hypothetical protein TNCV_1028011 [Trichonephila clavipes]